LFIVKTLGILYVTFSTTCHFFANIYISISYVFPHKDSLYICLTFPLLQLMTDRNIEDSEIESAPKLIEVVFQNCKGQVDQWVEPYLRLTVDRLQRAETSYVKSLLIQVVRTMWRIC